MHATPMIRRSSAGGDNHEFGPEPHPAGRFYTHFLFFVSVTPGMCMTLSMTLGMTIGVRRTFWMMAGELLGVGLVAAAAVIGVAT